MHTNKRLKIKSNQMQLNRNDANARLLNEENETNLLLRNITCGKNYSYIYIVERWKKTLKLLASNTEITQKNAAAAEDGN
jgi:hypothetical protein